jgi:hypothetical protein
MLIEHEGRSPSVDPRYAELFGRHRDDTVVG